MNRADAVEFLLRVACKDDMLCMIGLLRIDLDHDEQGWNGELHAHLLVRVAVAEK